MRGRRMPVRALPAQALQQLPAEAVAKLPAAQQALVEAAQRGVEAAQVALRSTHGSAPPRELEHRMQSEFFAAVAADPRLRGLPVYAVPNFAGTYGTKHQRMRHGARANEAGRRAGVPDVSVDVASGSVHGLRLEFKTDTGRLGPEQEAWHPLLRRYGYAVVVVRSAAEALALLRDYVAGGTAAQLESLRQEESLRQLLLRRAARNRAGGP
jgi:hypothetical protein